MTLFEIVGIFSVVVSVVLVLIFTGTLFVICKGIRRYKIILMTGLLLTSNLANCFIFFLQFQVGKAKFAQERANYITW